MEEFRKLIGKAQAGDNRAREILIEDNLGLVRHVVKRFAGRGSEEEDLFQIGTIGLMRAIDRFDTAMDVRFSTYAVPLILGEIKRYLRDDGPIKVSRSIRENALKVSRARERLRKEWMREPRLDELAKEAELSREETLLAMESENALESLDSGREVEDGNMVPLGERIASTGGSNVCACTHPVGDMEKDKLLDRMVLLQMWEGLSKEEQKLIWLRYFRDRTQTQVSKELGISQVQVSRKEKKILEKMRESVKS